MTISKFAKLTKQDVDALMKLDLAKIDGQNIFLYMTQVPLHKYHVPLVEKIMKIVPIYSYEVKQIMDDRYPENFVYREEKKERVLLEPVFEEKRKKRRNDEKKHIRRANKIEAKAKAVNVVAEKKEYKKKIDDMYRKIRSQK